MTVEPATGAPAPTTSAMDASADPLLQPFELGRLTLRNRIVSTSHEPAYTELEIVRASCRERV